MRAAQFTKALEQAMRTTCEKALQECKEKHVDACANECREIIDAKIAEMLPFIVTGFNVKNMEDRVSIYFK